MGKSKVYFTNFKASGHENLLQKLRRLMITAGMKDIDFADKYAAIKIHFGFFKAELCKGNGRPCEGMWREAVFNGLQYIICRKPEKCA